jgi:colanic acid biosynthesis glycosyl transferase WcaI
MSGDDNRIKEREKILVVGINYRPELTGVGKFTGEMAEWLADHGMEVRVITAPPYYPAWRIAEGYSGSRYKTEFLNGVKVLRCPLWVPRKSSGLKRILHLSSFAISSFLPTLWTCLSWRPNWVMVMKPPLMCLPGALLATKMSGAKPWLHVQDFEVDAAFDLGLLKSPAMRRLALGVERWLMRRCVRVSTISERMLERLESKQVAASARFLFPNWVDTGLIAPLNGSNRLREELAIPASEKIVLLYSGNMGTKQGLDLIINVAATLADNARYLFIMCGDGVAREQLEIQAGTLQNVLFLPLQPLERFNELLNLADIHLLPQRADAEDLVMPSKLTAMLASGKPVIATARAGTQVARVVHVCGEVVPPGDVNAFRGAIERLGESPELRQRLGLAGRRYAEECWGKEAVLQNLMEELRKTD